MVHLNFTDLSEEAQNRLLELSKKDVERKFGDDIRKYVIKNYGSFETTIEEEALRNLYSIPLNSISDFLITMIKHLLNFGGVFVFN